MERPKIKKLRTFKKQVTLKHFANPFPSPPSIQNAVFTKSGDIKGKRKIRFPRVFISPSKTRTFLLLPYQ